MSDLSSRPNGPDTDEYLKSLTERVLVRVNDAGQHVDRRAPNGRRKASRHKAAGAARTPEQTRQVRSLRWVFRDLGRSYRSYRRQTGAPVSPDVRNAALRFKEDGSVASLVLVAARLDDLDILTW